MCNSSIRTLENDMAAIRSEHETQNRIIQGQKSALDGIIAELGTLRFMGKETEVPSVPQSLRATPAPETVDGGSADLTSVNNDEAEEKMLQEALTDAAISEGMIEETEENDIEMGEVEEDPKEKNRKKSREELEEGEATDASSELSEPPDD